jgi:hypothetical protein
LKPKLKPPGAKRLKLKCDILLSSSSSKFNVRRYTMEGGFTGTMRGSSSMIALEISSGGPVAAGAGAGGGGGGVGGGFGDGDDLVG